MDLQRALEWLGEDAPTLIVAGAGISQGPPSDAPGVAAFLHETMSLLLERVYGPPAPSEQIRRQNEVNEIAGALLPEACYGAIGQVFDTDRHLDMWGALGPATVQHVGAAPSQAHFMLVDLASARGWPIVTTNFDCFFEQAIDARGFKKQRLVPRLGDRVRLVAEPGRVSLLKLHGSTVDTTTNRGDRPVERVRSTAADLSRCARIVRRLDFNSAPSRLLVVGYSGRDLDLFPWLCENFASNATRDRPNVLWVDLAFGDGERAVRTHRASVLGSVIGVGAKANDLASAAGLVAPPAGVDDPDRASAFEAAARQAVRDAIEPLLGRSTAEAAAALAGVLSTIGRHGSIAELASQLGGPTENWSARLHGLVWLAGAYSSLDRYDEAITTARRARHEAARHLSLTGFGRASIAISYAATAAQSLTLPVPRGRRPLAGVLESYASVLWVTALVGPVAAVAFVRTRHQDRPDPGEYGLLADYLEHWIRLGALLERTRGRVWGTGLLLNGMWWAIERACEVAGHTVGVLNAGRYRARTQGILKWYDSAITRANLVGHPIGLAIAYRDAAEAEIRRGSVGDTIRLHLSKALQHAEAAQSPSLILKIRLLQLQQRLNGPMRADEVQELLDRASGCVALQAQRDAIMKALAKSG